MWHIYTQRQDWRWHGGECKGIAKVLPHSPTSLVRMVVRALQRMKKEQTVHGVRTISLTCRNFQNKTKGLCISPCRREREDVVSYVSPLIPGHM